MLLSETCLGPDRLEDMSIKSDTEPINFGAISKGDAIHRIPEFRWPG